ncbi:hypothetical protein CIK05_11600 [Bdellovibrio sp. qaytius]|nr:hypothetical protein CIK05_11600 [Bdellovibrio sp. qaytius]
MWNVIAAKKTGRSKVFELQRLLGVFVVFIFIFSIKVFSAPQTTTYQAKIIKPDGTALEAVSVNFRFTVLNPAADCVLYIEDYSAVNMAGSNGLISFSLGSGTKAFPTSGTATFKDIFNNSNGAITCLGSGNYMPASNHTRKIVMQFHDSMGWQTMPPMSINAVPYSMFATKADDTTLFNNKADTAFVQYTSIPTCTASTTLTFNGASFSCITGAGGGASGTITSGDVTTALGYTPVSAATLSASFTTVATSYSTVTATVSSLGTSVTAIASTVSQLSASMAALSGGGISLLNGSASATQTFSMSSIGSAPAVVTLNGVHNFRFPNAASSTITAGLLSNLDYLIFSNKMNATSAAVNTALGYTAADAANVTAVSASLSSLATSTAASFAALSGSGIGSLNGSSSATQTFANGSTGLQPGYVTANGIHTLNIPNAASNSVTGGLLSNADYVTFVNHGSSITTLSADIAAVSASVNSLSANKVTSSAASIAQVLGYIPAASGSVGAGGVTSVNGSTSATQTFGTGTTGNNPNYVTANGVHTLNIPFASAATTTAGLISYSDFLNFTNKITSSAVSIAQVLGYVPADAVSVTTLSSNVAAVSASLSSFAATTAASFSAISGSGISALNGSTSATQSFANSLTGSQPTYVSANGVHTLNIPYASTPAVAAGLISYLDYTNFSNKITSSAVSIAQVLGYTPAASGSFSLSPASIAAALGYTPGDAASVTTLISNVAAVSAVANSKITSSAASVAEVLGYVPSASGSVSVTSASIATALGYTPGDAASVTTLTANLATVSAAANSAQVGVAAVSASLSSFAATTAASFSAIAGTGISTFNGSTSATQSFGTGTTGNNPNYVTANGVHTLNIPFASAATTTAGLISYSDFLNFSNKITSSAVSIAQVLGYTPAASGSFSLSPASIAAALGYTPGDAASVTTLISNVAAVSAVANSKITSSAASVAEVLGYVPSASGSVSVTSASIATALGYTPGNAVSVTTLISDVAAVSASVNTVSASVATKVTSSAVSIAQVLGYIPAASGSLGVGGIASFNGSTSATQTFANSLTGSQPTYTIANGVHTLNIPYASTPAVTAGLISYLDYSNFSNKITSSAAAIAQVLGYTPAASGSFSLSSSSIATALGYTPGDAASVTTLIANVAAVSASVNTVSSTVATKITSSAASIAQVLGYTPAASGGAVSIDQLSDAISDGVYSVMLGQGAGVSTTGYAATAVGVKALNENTTGYETSAFGFQSLRYNTTGTRNSAFGTYSLQMNDSGSNNSAFGADSLAGLEVGNRNSAFGSMALSSVSGDDNIAVGYEAGKIASGTGNVFLGSNSGNSVISDSGNILIGYNTQVDTSGQNNFLNIGNSIYGNLTTGNVGVGVTTPKTRLDVSGAIRISMEALTCAASYAGTIRYNAGNVEYCNGTTWSAFGVAGAGITSFNSSTSATQTFANSLTGSQPTYVSANGVHTLNIPYASTPAVTAGLISYLDYTNFSNKITSSAASIAQVLGYIPSASGSVSVTSASIATALGYTPGNAVSVTTLISDVAAVSSTAATKITSSAASIAQVLGYVPAASGGTSSQWTTSGTAVGYTAGSVGVGTASPRQALDVAPATGNAIIRATSTNATTALQLYRTSGGLYQGPVLWANGTDLNFGFDSSENSGATLMRLTTNGYLGIGNLSPMTMLDVSGAIRISMDSATCAVSYAGAIRYNAGTVEFCNGSAWGGMGGGAAVTSLNGSTSATQTFANTMGGSSPTFISANGVHTLRMPGASQAGVTAGLITKSEYDTFNTKLSGNLASGSIFVGNSSGSGTAVALSGDATLSNLGVLSISGLARSKIAVGTAYRILTNSSSGALNEVAVTSSRAMISDSNGIPSASTVTSSELAYMSGVTSGVQIQLNARVQNSDQRLLPSYTSATALSYVRINASGTATELRTPAQVSADIGSNGYVTVLTQTASFTITNSQHNYLFIMSNAGTASLPALSTVTQGFHIYIKRTGFSQIAVVANGADTIEGTASRTIDVQGGVMELIATSSRWELLRASSTGAAGATCVEGSVTYTALGQSNFTVTDNMATYCVFTLTVKGAGGGGSTQYGSPDSVGGAGGGVTLNWTPSVSTSLNIYVGTAGTNLAVGGAGGGATGCTYPSGGYYAGGGGGASAVSISGTVAIISGGGGGAGHSWGASSGNGGVGGSSNNPGGNGYGTYAGSGGGLNTGGASAGASTFVSGVGGSSVSGGTTGGSACGSKAGGAKLALFNISGGGGGGGTSGNQGHGGGGGGGYGGGGGGSANTSPTTSGSGGGGGGGFVLSDPSITNFTPVAGSAAETNGVIIINWSQR